MTEKWLITNANMNEKDIKPDFYQVGGCLPNDTPSYVYREADDELIKNIKNNKFCYILSPRQVGKSSLRIRAANQLNKEGYLCISVDLTSLGSRNIKSEQWYYSFMYSICRGLNKTGLLRDWWKANHKNDLNEVLYLFLKDFALSHTDKNVVIFIDEIDSLVRVEESGDSDIHFFSVLRRCYQHKKSTGPLSRLNFVVLGVALPLQLAGQQDLPLFEKGMQIKLHDFELKNSKNLARGFEHLDCDKEELLEAIFDQTDGQPILTQKLCRSIAINERVIIDIKNLVKVHCGFLFINAKNLEFDNNLQNIENRIFNNKAYKYKMLDIYKKLYEGTNIKYKADDITQQYIILSGLVKVKKGELVISNNIYKEKFNEVWLNRFF